MIAALVTFHATMVPLWHASQIISAVAAALKCDPAKCVIACEISSPLV